jgi:hypothetical protein
MNTRKTEERKRKGMNARKNEENKTVRKKKERKRE